jgi:nucleoid-associated protein EbfC
MADSVPSDGVALDYVLVAQRARQMMRELEEARDELGRFEAHGLGGNGLVQATVSVEMTLVALTIDPSIIDPADPESLSELVREAVNDAVAQLAAKRDERIASISDGISNIMSGARGPRVPLASRLPPAGAPGQHP